MVRTWVTFYKKHREVLGADLVHVRRPSMQVGKEQVFNAMSDCMETIERHLDSISPRNCLIQGIDAWLHVNPNGREKGLAMVFNPTGKVPHTFHTFLT